MAKLRIYNINLGVRDILGPGYRAVAWLMGCGRRCEGCIAPEMWDYNGGDEVEVAELAEFMLQNDVDGVTISGGEPFDQPAGLAELLKSVKDKGKNTWVFTGYTMEELRKSNAENITLALQHIDVLVDGEYKQEQSGTFPYRGSANQNIIYLTTAIPPIPLDDAGGRIQVVMKGSELMIVGVPPPGFVEKFRKTLQQNGVELTERE
jgi:anaerobic ribonucleoside-triphosphate reductase activating protein